MKYLYSLVIGVALLMGFKNPSLDKNCPNLAVSANNRFLTSGGQPFFWLGDTGWLLLSKLNTEDAEQYLENRREKGFNVIQVMVLHSLSAVNFNGDSALINRNVSTPMLMSANAAKKNGYWENLDLVIGLAAKKGMYLALVPLWGSNVKSGHVSSKQAEFYAVFLAKRYKDKSNIVWLNGGDVRGDDSTEIWKTIGNTLKKYDPNHLVSYHPYGRTQSSEWFHNEPWLDFNMFQSGHKRYNQDTARNEKHFGEDNWRYIESDYKKTPVKPTLDGEPSYEGIPQGLHDPLQPRWKDNDIRRYAYWSVFSGGCGFTYGNNSVMQFYSPGTIPGSYGANNPWKHAMDDPGAGQLINLKNLMLKYHFESLTPDQSLLDEQGERYNHLVALRGNKCVLVYTYNGRAIKLNMSLIPGTQFIFSWYSPRTGQVIKGNSFRKDKTPEFDPPGLQIDGNDWVLILINN